LANHCGERVQTIADEVSSEKDQTNVTRALERPPNDIHQTVAIGRMLLNIRCMDTTRKHHNKSANTVAHEFPLQGLRQGSNAKSDVDEVANTMLAQSGNMQ